ncbi:hypothetical protein H9P43_005325 [Blastocladiella emersonii ATCC 22665]|nr:hypothetical protein H9P43_005325 [Blastocladiella emersonii ATCC 22665]
MSTAKVGYLFLRTMAKPIANAVKSYAKEHPRFSEFCIGFAQKLHRAEMTLKKSIFDYQIDHVRPLSDVRALEMGANFIGEATLFSLVATVVVIETTRSSISSKRKEAVQNQRITAAEDGIRDREQEILALRCEMAELKKIVEQFNDQIDELKARAEVDPAAESAVAVAAPSSSSWKFW